MRFGSRLLLLAVCFQLELFSESISTFYGTIEVDEPVLIELIHSPAIQRLKSIHQYGAAYYTTHREEYNRYDHSLGVFTILKLKGASLDEQIAGLLHDASHTAFSHVGDWVFEKVNQEKDYQSTIHKRYLDASGIGAILNKYGYTIDQVIPENPPFEMLEQPLPNLCADRIDYNIQGAYFQNFLSYDEALSLLEDLRFIEGRWILTRKDLAAKLMRFSLFMTEDCWGSAANHFTSRWLADAIIQGLKIDLISSDEFHFGVDQVIWDKLQDSSDPLIQRRMHMIENPDDHYSLVELTDATFFITFKCRGIDPWIEHEGKNVRLSTIDSALDKALQKTKLKASRGWPLRPKSLALK